MRMYLVHPQGQKILENNDLLKTGISIPNSKISTSALELPISKDIKKKIRLRRVHCDSNITFNIFYFI